MSSIPFPHSADCSAPTWQARLEWQARLRHLRQRPWRLAGAIVLLSITLLATWWRLRLDGAGLLSMVRAYCWPLAVLAFAAAWRSTRHAAIHARHDFAQSWFAATPLSQDEVDRTIRQRVGRRLALPTCVVLLLPLAAMAASAQGAWSTWGMLAVGVGGGVFGGWFAAKRAPAFVAAPLPPRLAAQASTADAADLTALARWPFARWLADVEPRRHARMIAAVLLLLPAGIPPMAAMLAVAFVVCVVAAWELLRAVLATLPQAAAWLQATPLPLAPFARALIARPAAALAVLIAIAGLCLAGLGVSAARVGGIAVGAFVALSIAILQSLAWRYQARRARREILATAALALVLLTTAAWLLPWLACAAGLRGLLQLRRA